MVGVGRERSLLKILKIQYEESSVTQYDDCNPLDPDSKKRLAKNRKMYDLSQNE